MMWIRRLLARMDQRKALTAALSSWTVRCRDERGARAEIEVRLVDDTLVLCSESEGPWTLTPLQAGRLRGAVREALFTLDRDAAAEETENKPDSQGNAVHWVGVAPKPLST
jgi:hypothetical protein